MKRTAARLSQAFCLLCVLIPLLSWNHGYAKITCAEIFAEKWGEIPFNRNPLGKISSADCSLPTSQQCRSEEHTSELQSLMRISYAVFCLKKKKTNDHPYH